MVRERDWANLAKQVRARRDELSMTQADVAEAGGPSTAVQRQIENEQATSYRPKTFHSHEKALRLRRDSFRQALAGGSFVPLDDDWPVPEPPPPRDQVSLDGLPPGLKQAIRKMVEEARQGRNERSA